MSEEPQHETGSDVTHTMLRRRRRRVTSTPGHAPRPVRRPPRPGEEGFTLIELLIVIVILPLVMGAITMVLITTLKDQQGVEGKVTDSAAAATASEFFTRDVQSAASVSWATSPKTAPPQCSAAGVSGSATLLLGLQLQVPPPGTTTVVSYYTVAPSSGPAELVRFSCTGGSSTPTSHDVLSDNLNADDPPVAVAPCISPTPTSIPTGVTCAPQTDWTPTYLVSAISINVTQASGCTTASACPPYQYTLTGNPQTGIPVPPVVPPCGVLTLLGTGNDITFAVAANQTVQANGPIVLDSGYSGNPAIYGIFTFGDTVTAQTSTSCSSIPSKDTLQVYNCLGTASDGASANFQACFTSGSHDPVSSGINVSPPPVQTVATPSDPMAIWAQQNAGASNIKVTGTGACSTVGTTMTCTSGLYSGGLNIPNNRTVTFGAGNYQFNNNGSCGSSLCVGSSDTVYFGSGHYIYANGIEVAGSGSALCGGGVANSSCPEMPSGGVFFYVKSGKTDLGNLNSGNVIDLGAIPVTQNGTDPYAGVLLWQDGTDSSNPVTLTTALTATVNTLNGEIYAPNATIDLGAFSGGQSVINTGEIVANSINFSLSNQLQLNVG